MRTPSLHRRVVAVGVLVVVVVVASVNTMLYLTFRAQMLANLEQVLDERTEVVRSEARRYRGAELAIRLTQLGVGATIRTPDGSVLRAEPPLPNSPAAAQTVLVSRDVQLDDGTAVTLFARRGGVDDATRRVLVLEGLGLLFSTALAALLLTRASRLVLRPLHLIAESARRTAAGQLGERLRPDRPRTSLGKLATAYDDMVDGLEQAAKRANDAQFESELLYLQLYQTIETANAAFVAMNSDGVVTEWNTQAEETFGWSRKEAIGRSLADMVIPSTARAAHRDGLRRFVESGEHTILGRTVEFEAQRRNGQRFPVEVATWVTHVGDEVTFNGFVRDITERRRGEEAIARLAAIVASAQEAIFSTDLSGTIVTWNDAAEHIYQHTAAEAIGSHVSLISSLRDMDDYERLMHQIRRGESLPRHETVRRRKDGTTVHVATTVSPILDSHGVVTGASAIARDVSEEHRMVARLAATMGELEMALGEARRSEERSRQFLADAAHQLRSPVSGIRACAETLLLGTSETDSDSLLADLVRETSRAGRLISSLLLLARVDHGTLALVLQGCDVGALCRSEVARARMLAPELEIRLDIGEPAPEYSELDRDAISEVLSNLLDNARRHATSSIDVRVCFADTGFQIQVLDDGPGVPDELVDRVFERFMSLDGKGGSGLGLPIARALARAHGGDLTCDRRGFYLTVPWNDEVTDSSEYDDDAGAGRRSMAVPADTQRRNERSKSRRSHFPTSS
jgi:PAS domain S-box-containing protein